MKHQSMTVIKEYGRLLRQAVKKHRRYTARQQYRHAMTNEQLAIGWSNKSKPQLCSCFRLTIVIYKYNIIYIIYYWWQLPSHTVCSVGCAIHSTHQTVNSLWWSVGRKTRNSYTNGSANIWSGPRRSADVWMRRRKITVICPFYSDRS